MSSIPNSRAVNQSFQTLRTATRKAIKGLNQKAASRMAKGDYASADELAAKCREVQQFLTEVDALRAKWKEVRSGGHVGVKISVTPLWEFYQPILKSLQECGGEAVIRDLEPAVERIMSESFQPGDRTQLSRGRDRWRVMIRRARKHIVAEGWIENHKGIIWKITDKGRQAAEKTPTSVQQ